MQEPNSFFPPDPMKIGEYIENVFSLATEFAIAMTTLVVTFAGALGQVML